MRDQDLDHFYLLLDRAAERCGGTRWFASCQSSSGWPAQGVYFFFEPGEMRGDKNSPRVVRVGTHAVTATSKVTLWKRLRQHRGTVAGGHPGGGNHRSSIFRLHVGAALIARDGWDVPTWGVGNTAPKETRNLEYPLEQAVSAYIGAMPFIWAAVPNAGDGNDRGFLERNAIALLSNLAKDPVDPPSKDWLGLWSTREAVKASGLWNVNHVQETCDPTFLDRLATYVD